MRKRNSSKFKYPLGCSGSKYSICGFTLAWLLCIGTLIVALTGCGSTPPTRSNASTIVLPPNLIVENSEISDDGETWEFKARLKGEMPVVSASLFHRNAGSSGAFKEQKIDNKNGLDNLQWRTDTDGSTRLDYYLVLEDVEGQESLYGSSTTPVSVRAPRPKPEKTAVIDYDDNCKKPGLFQKIPAKAYVTRKTRIDGGQNVPYGNTGRVDLNDGMFHPYVKLSSLQIREYNYVTRLYDASGKIVYRGSSTFDNKQHTTNWTSWVNYTPGVSDALGKWTFVFCEGGYRQAETRFTAYRS